jgi:ribosomal protein S6E (S10)
MMSLTVDKKSNELAVYPYKGTPFQKFSILSEQGKFAIVVPKTKSALCIFGDKQENAAKAVMDPGQHTSSWFQIVCADKGLFAKKGYLIKTHANGKALDISGGKAVEGTPVVQYDIHQNGNQLWMLVPVQEPKAAKHKKEEGDVAPKFKPKAKSYYKIVSALDATKALTLNPTNLELQVKTFDDEANQKFSIHSENDKFGIVACGSLNGLCVFGDKVDNSAKVIADSGKHLSSWFDIVRTEKGPFAYKGYIIMTHTGTMALDISGGKAEDNKPVVQYQLHENGNQVWLFEEVVMPNVPANFKPDANIAYRIVSALDKKKALTVDAQKSEVVIRNFSGNDNQKFTIILEKHKYAFVTPNKNALCIFGDKQDNLAPVVSDPGKHNSSWFEIARAKDGPLATKGYVIKTHANGKTLDITGGQPIEGKPVIQNNLTENGSEIWLIEPFLQEANKPE